MKVWEWVFAILFLVAFLGTFSLLGLGTNNTIEIPRENGCVEIVTDNNRVFEPDTIDKSLVCTKEIG